MSMRFIRIMASKARLARVGIGAADQARKLPRDDLPREAIAILDPAALLGLRHGGERVAQAIDLGLRFDRDLERNRLIEFEERPAIETGECCPIRVNSTMRTSPALPEG